MDPALAHLGERIGRTSPTALARTRALLWASSRPSMPTSRPRK
ncbi:hypothetical protein [Streptomyces sp. TM32]|nr:hypothetical protein [Streptomyces sp. TM32]